MAEYNAYQAAAAEKIPAAQIKCLDDFVSKYPSSALLNYIYPLYYKDYSGQKNFPKTIEYADKLIALGRQSQPPAEMYEAYSVALTPTTIFRIPMPLPATQRAPRHSRAEDDRCRQKARRRRRNHSTSKRSSPLSSSNGTAANAAMAAKDYAGAVESYKAVLALNAG